VILSPFDPATILLMAAVLAPQEVSMSSAAAHVEPAPGITPRDVALRLYDQGFVPATLPRREEQLVALILEAFKTPYEGRLIRFSELPARRADIIAVRRHLELITRAAERAGRSLECERYRPAFVAPIGRKQA
jgi:hypothetical protein